jgi:DNA-binding NarL/FixJ family response regulator
LGFNPKSIAAAVTFVMSSSEFARQEGDNRYIVPAERDHLNIVLIENTLFMSGCIAKALSASVPCAVRVFSTTDEFIKEKEALKPAVVIVSFSNDASETISRDLGLIAAADARNRTIVFGQRDDAGAALFAIGHGASGYISTTMGWDAAIEAIRIVLAGGTYIPVKYFIDLYARAVATINITERELTVLRAIQFGKANKVIAKELNLSVSTVKVHVRHVMTKLQARNRTELAVRSAETHWPIAPPAHTEADQRAQGQSESPRGEK